MKINNNKSLAIVGFGEVCALLGAF